MTTAATQLPAPRPFTPEECAALTAAGIIAEREQAAVLAGKRCFTVDECLAMLSAGILHEDDRTELIEGVLIYMPPIGDYHVGVTIWLNQLLVQALAGRALVQPQCPIYLNDRSAPEPDIAVVRWRPITESSLLLSRPTCIWSSKLPTARCATTAAQSWPGTPPPASRRYGSPTCGHGK